MEMPNSFAWAKTCHTKLLPDKFWRRLLQYQKLLTLKDSFAYPHYPYRNNDVIFRILCLLSRSHVRVSCGGDRWAGIWIYAHPDRHHQEHRVYRQL